MPDAELIEVTDEEKAEFDLQHRVAETELVVGVVAAVGTDVNRVVQSIAQTLERFGYTPTELRLSDLLRELDWDEPLTDDTLDQHIATYMDAGNRLRGDEGWKRADAMALLAVSKLRAERHAAQEAGDPLERRAWILRQLKTPSEVATLRDVYGSRFVLVAAYSPDDVRAEWLAGKIKQSHVTSRIKPKRGRGNRRQPAATELAKTLMERDESEGKSEGQNVRDTFHRADFFVDAAAEAELDASMQRVFSILFGDPFCTPTKDEFGLFQAAGAARLSAEPGRQVGAAIATQRGEIVALGANEVPRPRGGVYMSDDHEGSVPDGREFRFQVPTAGRKVDTNDRMKREIAAEISDALKNGDRGWLAADAPPDAVLAAILETRLGDLTEFGRAVHAEMAAILDAARHGRAIADSVLYTTTFPCHNCARHIIGAGITRVVYVEPYAKSMADELHPDAITVARSHPESYKVRFEPFVGVAPARYMDLFFGQLRKNDDDGTLELWDDDARAAAKPRLPDLDPPELRQNRPSYRVREVLLQRVVQERQEQSSIRIRTEAAAAAPGGDDRARRQDARA